MDPYEISSTTSSSSSSDEDPNAQYEMACEQLVKAALYFKKRLDEAGTSTGPPRTRKVVNRQRDEANQRLLNDYFDEGCVYDEGSFRRRFRMSKGLFMRIVNDLQSANPYFLQKWDARGGNGFSTLQKCTSAIRQLAYGTAPDGLDDYLHMSERTSREVLQKFCKWVTRLYGNEYLRRPTAFDIQQIYAHHESHHGFPGMLGSFDCTHWDWANCPVAWRGQYMRGDHNHPSLMLEAVASQDLWFWHEFFGVAGSNNDLNVLNQSPLFNDVIRGKAPDTSFQVNGVEFKHGYYLVDGIYPEWAVFVKAFRFPQDEKRKKFKKAQESARKDVERGFGVLKKRWQILHNPARPWTVKKLSNIIYACVILHNLILQDEGKAICSFDESDLPMSPEQEPSPDTSRATLLEIRDRDTHFNLRTALVEHISTLESDDEDDE